MTAHHLWEASPTYLSRFLSLGTTLRHTAWPARAFVSVVCHTEFLKLLCLLSKPFISALLYLLGLLVYFFTCLLIYLICPLILITDRCLEGSTHRVSPGCLLHCLFIMSLSYRTVEWWWKPLSWGTESSNFTDSLGWLLSKFWGSSCVCQHPEYVDKHCSHGLPCLAFYMGAGHQTYYLTLAGQTLTDGPVFSAPSFAFIFD